MPEITAADFIAYCVTDNPVPCASCAPTDPSSPMLIKGKQYCLWCALQIARELLSRDIVTVQQIHSVGELTDFLKS